MLVPRKYKLKAMAHSHAPKFDALAGAEGEFLSLSCYFNSNLIHFSLGATSEGALALHKIRVKTDHASRYSVVGPASIVAVSLQWTSDASDVGSFRATLRSISGRCEIKPSSKGLFGDLTLAQVKAEHLQPTFEPSFALAAEEAAHLRAMVSFFE